MSTWCSKHVEAWNKLIVKQKFSASSWLITKINILRCCRVSKTSKKLLRRVNLCPWNLVKLILLTVTCTAYDVMPWTVTLWLCWWRQEIPAKVRRVFPCSHYSYVSFSDTHALRSVCGFFSRCPRGCRGPLITSCDSLLCTVSLLQWYLG